ncbi:MAG: Asp-tRNA(Asn)/Glu-tRNA(Gln) amidotransferase subunit GatB [Parcubacteria group bacterium]|nr:Asp-tRNA(Asn)/Glu-tRNA(Gln) amidotransferase subunit GatB [Parcubacteria group bacterium]
MKYQPTIGLEIHAELKTKTKMFCDSLNDPDEKHPNINICPICLGHPGTLPVINKEAVAKVIKAGLALNSEIAEFSKFDRKNYFYPDLPKGYQISQYDLPFCKNGHLEMKGKKIRIRRIHLEEDTGRLIHDLKTNSSLIDFNRAGIPLMELVTEPDIESGEEARLFSEELQLIFRYLGVSDADMEKGQMRSEANISLSQDKKLGVKVEIKNLNSLKAIEKAIEYEINRQRELLEKGEKIIQETRGWNEDKGVTYPQRVKEEAADYRYFPEPDLPPLKPAEIFDIEKIKMEIPELPAQKRKRFEKEYNLGKKDIEIFIRDLSLADYFEEAASELLEWSEEEEKRGPKAAKELYKLAANYLLSDLSGLIKEKDSNVSEILITPENFAEFINLIYEDKISSRTGKDVLKEMFASGEDPSEIIREKGLLQISGFSDLEKIVEDIIDKNEKVTYDYKTGKENAMQFLIGQAMAKTKGRANPKILQELFKKFLI